MPIWSYEEIEKCRNKIYNHLTKEKVLDLFSKWRGIPRYVLEKAQEVNQQRFLEEAIIKSSNPKLFDFVGEIDHSEDIGHIVHIHTNPGKENEEDPYTDKFMLFASEYVSEKVTDRFIETYKTQLKYFIAAYGSLSELGPLKGKIFEGIAHRILQGGGSFDICCLDSGESSVIQFPS